MYCENSWSALLDRRGYRQVSDNGLCSTARLLSNRLPADSLVAAP